MFTAENIVSIYTTKEFHKTTMKVFRFQFQHNEGIKILSALKSPENVKHITEILYQLSF